MQMDEALNLPRTIAAAIAGDVAATASVLLLYRSRVLAYIERKLPTELRRTIDAQDVLQDTQFRAARQISKFRDEGDDALGRWLLTIARNRMLELLEQSQAAKRGGGVKVFGDSLDVVLAEVLVDSKTPSQDAAGREWAKMVQDALQQLPADQRTAIQLRHIEGYSVAQAANRMGKSEAAVTMLCNRGIRGLREILRSISRFL